MLNSMTDRGILDSTWGGNLVDMVRFVQEMKIVRQEQLIEKVPVKAEYMVSGLNDLAFKYSNLIFNVRGMGLYQGFSMRNPANKNKLINIALQQHHILLLGAGAQTIRLRPVLDVEVEDIERMLSKLNICLSCLQNG
ncbi:MAG: putative L-lysine-epsilon aminotransferase [Firmicutes bacterium ADurb.Bin419]|nr:MAG: putative L-lysine-epsilon aminotransferase [Firmicutes bacterium ADurb.Bin419]